MRTKRESMKTHPVLQYISKISSQNSWAPGHSQLLPIVVIRESGLTTELELELELRP